ncbi:restriction endonuclease subunit S [Vibrio sp. 1CM7H]|uniref:restriction endonuclease subunit S n=1 Tax=Vibrio sp. 1CM7H TaxID=2929168 RepID=UPI0020BEBD80|nr:restriction endonuclease subunit S [Vibrio sp. 1CM7H]MCK8065150.1 restriction endonuclease subunit S [Vibrio sp. 1CM7H]
MAVENLITEHIDIWTSAVKTKSTSGRGSSKKLELYGVKKLRELILELAVRGKLVPQDPSDEPASVLLERIAQEKAQLVKEKKIKKPRKYEPIDDNSLPFNIPSSWKWARIEDLGHDLGQKKPDKTFTYVDVGSINKELGYIDEPSILEHSEAPSRARKLVQKNTVIYSTVRPYLLNIAVIDRDFNPEPIASTAFAIIHPLSGISSSYIYRYLRSPSFIEYVESVQTGIAYPAINDKQFFFGLIPVPPTAEQHRIVAKVDELMALCDQLEQQTEASIEAHQVLVTTLLDTLTNSADADELMQNWSRISEHFDTLFTTEESIDQLKQTILQLAVMGKLVPQDPSDEPAGELLKRITDEKAQLVKDKVYQKTSKLKPRNELISYPKGWVGVQTGQVCPSIVPNRDRPKSFTGNIPWVTLPAFPQQSLYLDSTKVELALTETEVQKYSARLIPEGSVLMSCVGRFGLTAINTIPVTSNQQVHAFITLKGLLPEYLSMVIRVEGKVLETIATSTTIAYLNKTNCESIQFGLPPENEQRLIVEKAKELIDLCEQLKVRVKEFQATQHNLTDAIVEQAV